MVCCYCICLFVPTNKDRMGNEIICWVKWSLDNLYQIFTSFKLSKMKRTIIFHFIIFHFWRINAESLYATVPFYFSCFCSWLESVSYLHRHHATLLTKRHLLCCHITEKYKLLYRSKREFYRSSQIFFKNRKLYPVIVLKKW